MYRDPFIKSQTYVNGVRVVRLGGIQSGFATVDDGESVVGTSRIFFGIIAIETSFVGEGFLVIYFSSGYVTSLELPAI